MQSGPAHGEKKSLQSLVKTFKSSHGLHGLTLMKKALPKSVKFAQSV
jgi:hypothetical protein